MNPTVWAIGHPCFDEKAHNRVGRMHIPVAPACNIKCRYCYRDIGGTDNRPGVAYKILNPVEALEAVERVIGEDKSIKVIGVAGPGDALANEATFESLRLIHNKFPGLKKCISTNGLLLAEKVDALSSAGVSTISVTVNAVKPEVGREFYKSAYLNGKIYRDKAFDALSARQLLGIKIAARKGIVVKINTVLVPELNGNHIEDIAIEMKKLGASLMNIMPLKPIAEMSSYRAPTCFDLEKARYSAEKHIPQFRACKQCRADAVGIPGLEGVVGEHGHGGHGNHGLGGQFNPTLSEIYMGVPLYH